MQEQASSLWRFGVLLLASCLLATTVTAAESAEPRKLRTILKELKSAETDTYELFNALNSNDEFDFVCYQYEETGSKLRRRTCEPQFMRTARKQEADRFMQGRQNGTDRAVPMVESGLQFATSGQMIELQRELQSLTQQNPDLAMKMDRMQALADEYASHPRAQKDEPSLGFLARFLLRNAMR